jgi:hypothetical protein
LPARVAGVGGSFSFRRCASFKVHRVLYSQIFGKMLLCDSVPLMLQAEEGQGRRTKKRKGVSKTAVRKEEW